MAVQNRLNQNLPAQKKPKEITYDANGKQVNLSVETVKNYLVSGDKDRVTNQEVVMFINLCKFSGLNPWLKEAYCIKYGTEPATMVVGKEVVAMYEKLGTQKAVAKALSIGVDTVRYALRNEHINIEAYPAKKLGKPVFMYDKNNNFICEFPSYGEASRWLQINNKTNIVAIEKVVSNLSRAVDQRKRKTAFGYIWYSEKQ